MRVYIRTRQPEPNERVSVETIAVNPDNLRAVAGEIAASILEASPNRIMVDVDIRVTAQAHITALEPRNV